jgi:hypothetical protein
MILTIETKCYEKDWKIILTKSRLTKVFKRCDFKNAKRVVFINNVTSRDKVEKRVSKLKSKNIIDQYYFVEDYELEVLKFFNLKRENFTSGYYYSIQELTGIYLCDTPYLLHFAGDSILRKVGCHENWIESAIEIMNEENDFIVANASWDSTFKEPELEAFRKIDDFYIGQGFSDQCYLIKTADFKKPIYDLKHTESERYPKYGGELFEKRVDSYMRVINKYRLTSKYGVYNHLNAPNNLIQSLLRRIFHPDY